MYDTVLVVLHVESYLDSRYFPGYHWARYSNSHTRKTAWIKLRCSNQLKTHSEWGGEPDGVINTFLICTILVKESHNPTPDLHDIYIYIYISLPCWWCGSEDENQDFHKTGPQIKTAQHQWHTYTPSLRGRVKYPWPQYKPYSGLLHHISILSLERLAGC